VHWLGGLGRSGWALPLGVLGAGLAVTAAAALWLNEQTQQQAQADFDRAADRLVADVVERLTQPVSGLRGAAGVYAANKKLDRRAFDAYVGSLDLARDYPGVQGFGLIERVPADRAGAFVAAQRLEGEARFAIHPTPVNPAADRYVARFVQPEYRNVDELGLDMASQPLRMAAIERAVATGEPTLSAATPRAADARAHASTHASTQASTQASTDARAGASLVLMLPLYRDGTDPQSQAQRRAALVGVLYAPIVAGDVLRGILRTQTDAAEIVLQEAAPVLGAAPLALFDSLAQRAGAAGATPARPPQFTATRNVQLMGRSLDLRLTSTARFDAAVPAGRVLGRTLFGTLLSIMLALFVRQQQSGRQRAEALAAQMTADLSRDVVARRATEARLAALVRENEALLGTIRTHAIVSVTDARARLIDVNDAFCRLSGYDRDELVGQNHAIVNSNVQPAEFWRALWADISAGKPWRGEISGRAKGGTLYWTDTIIAPFLGADGHIEKYVALHTDITASKHAAQMLALQQQRLSNIIEGTQVATWEWNLQTGAVRYNERWAEMLGEASGSLLQSTADEWTARSHPDDALASTALLKRHCRGELPALECETRVRHHNGHWVWLLTRGKVMGRDENGRPLSIVGTHMDITKRKRAEAESQRSAELLRAAIDTIDEAFVLYDPDDRLVLCNDRYREIYPRMAHLMVPGARFEDIVRYGAEIGEYAQAAGRVDDWMAERMAAHRSGNSVLVQKLDTGRTLRIVERKMPDGHIVGFRIDITELVQATEAAQKASLAKSQFLANMSHEIRTPMNAILGMLALLRKTELSPRQADYAAKTDGAARSLLGLLNDILDFSKVEAGKMALDPHPFSIDQLLRDLSVILSSTAGAKPLEVLFDIDPTLPPLLVGDALRLKQVLINLGGNAVKFTAQGEVVLSVQVVSRSADGVTLDIAVRDTGIGIAPENLARIFGGFTQAEASTTRRYGGSGLGVVISQRLVALMGGELAVDSTLGQGSRFHFQINLALAPAEAGAAPAPTSALRALVVDDNPTAREVLQRMGQSLGWVVDVADSGAAALELLQRQRAAGVVCQAVFVDWQMPGLDGWATSQRIRELAMGRDMPVVVMVTAHGREMLSHRAPAEQALLDGFLVKPVTATMLLEALVGAGSVPCPEAAQRALTAASGPRLSGMRLLLVEDNLNNQQVALELLEDEGAQVQLAHHGLEAVQAVAAANPTFDAVLMDLQMPVMDGFTATARIRHGLLRATLPIVAMTANALAGDREACLAAGMNDHVGKPFDLDHLVAVLRRVTGRQDEPVAARDRPVDGLPAAVLAAATAAGVDVDTAVARLGGKAAVYRRMLARFVTDLASWPAQLQTDMAQGGELAAARQLHTLKGVAATLGAAALASLAGQAERHLSAGASAAESRLAMAGVVDAINAAAPGLRALLRALQAHDDQPTAAADADVAAVADPVALRDGLQTLAGLLRNSDMAALETLAGLQRQHPQALGGRLVQLDEFVAGLDFVPALACCDELLAELQA
jgi:PAS domain S-box-containing protein